MVAGSSSRLRNRKRGMGTAALASSSRCRYLSLAAIAACTGLPLSVSLVAIAAATIAVLSSTPMTPLTGYCSANPAGLLTFDFEQPERAADAVRVFAKQYPVHGVIGVDDKTAIVAAAIATRLTVHGHPV